MIEDAAGRWVEIDRPPYMLEPLYCAACGAMIPRRYWEIEGRRYCNPECEGLERRVEELQRRYPEPIWPPATPPAE